MERGVFGDRGAGWRRNLRAHIGHWRAARLDVGRGCFDSSRFLNDMESKYLGKTVRQPVEELDTFPTPAGVSSITMRSDDVVSSCPITGEPDHYTVAIEYEPDALCIESKSLKLYLWGFAKTAQFAEAMTAQICERVAKDVLPKSCKVTSVQKARGGITIETVARYPRS